MSAIEDIIQLIKEQKSFVLEAGAGSGKTFTLIQTLNYLLAEKGAEFRFHHKTIVCITYTNVAKNEILNRLENNPLVEVLTIHEFLWSKIKSFQKQLLIELDLLNSKMSKEKPEKYFPDLLERNVVKIVSYDDTAFRDFEKGQLHHDDVIVLATNLLSKYEILCTIISAKHPYIFIDEYQDTSPEVVSSFIDSILPKHSEKLVLGFYGDSYQKIYDTGVGSLDYYIETGKLTLVTKKENFRSSTEVVALLNNFRTNIQQIIPEGLDHLQGSSTFINCDNYPSKGLKEKVTDYERSINPLKKQNYEKVIEYLSGKGWHFGEQSPDKILIIANSRVAERGNFGNLYRIASSRYGERATDALMKRENTLVRYFLGSVDKRTSRERKSGIEHLLSYWKEKNYSSVMSFLNRYGQIPNIRSTDTGSYFFLRKHIDKVEIASKLDELDRLANNASVSEVFQFAFENRIVGVPESLSKYLTRIKTDPASISEDKDRERQQDDITFYNAVMALPYNEFQNLFKHTQNNTVFSTKHGTKGNEFRNVLVVIDDTSWKQMYNFENFFNNSDENAERQQRSKNLFYVSCSRAKENLVVLALSEMKPAAISVLQKWFSPQNVFSIESI